MPKPPAPPPTGLDEVERALSVLEGRHPEHERTRRETMAAAEARRHVLESELAARSRRRRRRAVVIGINVVVLAGACVVGWRLMIRTRGIRSSLQHDEAPFVTRGMNEIASNELSASSHLELDAPGSSCFVAVSTGGVVEARQGAMSVQGKGSAGWCACAAGRVMLEGAPGGGIALLQIDARHVGGALARAWTELAPAAWGDAGGECAEATLDDWIADHGGLGTSVEASWLEETPARPALKRAGFRMLAGVDEGRPFGVVESAPGECMLAIAENGDELALRATGGQRRIARAKGALAWCANVGEVTTVWREGRSRVVVLAAPAAHVGGLLGARECADLGGHHVAADATWLRDEDLSWDAASVLKASGLSDVKTAELPIAPGEASARVAALVRSPAALVASEPAAVVVVCDPGLDASSERTTVCTSAAPVSWWRRNDAPAAMARAPLPFWLSLLEPHGEPDATACISELLALARRLTREGFEPTVLEGVTELPDGIRVVGRAGEDAVVAVGIASKPPWAMPYTDGIPWDLGDPPRIVELQPGLSIKLGASPPPSAPLDRRRTVVFRHAKRP